MLPYSKLRIPLPPSCPPVLQRSWSTRRSGSITVVFRCSGLVPQCARIVSFIIWCKKAFNSVYTLYLDHAWLLAASLYCQLRVNIAKVARQVSISHTNNQRHRAATYVLLCRGISFLTRSSSSKSISTNPISPTAPSSAVPSPPLASMTPLSWSTTLPHGSATILRP